MNQSTSNARVGADLKAVPWVAGMGVALLGTWMLYAAQPGLNWCLCTLAAAAGFVWSEQAGGKHLSAARGVPLALGCVLAGGTAVTANPILHLLILVSVGILAAVLTLYGAGLPPARLGLGSMITAPFRATAACLMACAAQLRALMGLARAERGLPLLRGAFLAVPIGLIFFLLLSTADPTMAQWRDAAWDALIALSFLPRLLFFAILAVAALGSFALAAQLASAAAPESQVRQARPATLRDVERLMVLSAVAGVFALFLVLQLAYLFGNPGGRAGSGVSYADAVHRGFGELTVAAALCLLLALALDHFALRGSRESQARALTLILIAQAGLLLVSAHVRIAAYEKAYGFTLERLYVHAYTIMTAIALLLLAWEVWTAIDARRLFRRLGLVAALAIAMFCYWNHAAWIARQNMERYRRTGMIDVNYLVTGLGDDALPELIHDLPALSAPLAQQAHDQLMALRQRRGVPRPARWYEWNLRRAAARDALASLAGDNARGSVSLRLCAAHSQAYWQLTAYCWPTAPPEPTTF
jgi:hypothetical protein